MTDTVFQALLLLFAGLVTGLAGLGLFCAAILHGWATLIGKWPGDPEHLRTQTPCNQSIIATLFLPFLEIWTRLTNRDPWFDPDHLEDAMETARDLGLGATLALDIDPDEVIKIRYGLRETRLGRDPEPFLEIVTRAQMSFLHNTWDAPDRFTVALGRLLGPMNVRLKPIWNRTFISKAEQEMTLRVRFDTLSAHQRMRALKTYRDLTDS